MARRMMDMLRSSVWVHSCNVAPCARRLLASFCWAGAQGRGPPHVLSLGLGAAPAFRGMGVDQVTPHIRRAAENGERQP